MSKRSQRLSSIDKVRLVLRIWFLYFEIQVRLRRHTLPEVVDQLSKQASPRRPAISPGRLGTIVYRVLRIGVFRARCLLTSLVLYRLMIEQNDMPQLVIGMPETPTSTKAHSWIEYRGHDIGPPPGRGAQIELVRYPDQTRQNPNG